MDPFSDDLARFTYGASTHYVKDWFGRDEGPHKHRLDKAGKHMKDMAAAAAKAIHTKKLEVKAVLGSASNVKLDARQKRVREEALDKARAVMANKTETVSFVGLDASDARGDACGVGLSLHVRRSGVPSRTVFAALPSIRQPLLSGAHGHIGAERVSWGSRSSWKYRLE